jgi:hypothetical protein
MKDRVEQLRETLTAASKALRAGDRSPKQIADSLDQAVKLLDQAEPDEG